jgi:hypothetical protein
VPSCCGVASGNDPLRRTIANDVPTCCPDVSSPGFRRQLRRVRRLLLLACHVPRLPRLALGLRLRLQLLVRLSTLWRCGGCHISFQGYLSDASKSGEPSTTALKGRAARKSERITSARDPTCAPDHRSWVACVANAWDSMNASQPVWAVQPACGRPEGSPAEWLRRHGFEARQRPQSFQTSAAA